MQSKKHSLFETIANTASGAVIAYMITLYLLPWWGFEPTATEALEITIIYYRSQFTARLCGTANI